MNRLLVVVLPVVAIAVGAALAAPAATIAGSGSITIRHDAKGCHTWSLNGGPYRPMLETRIARGGAITITNNDPMVHKLIQLAGPRVGMQHMADGHMARMGLQDITGRGVMNHMQSRLRVSFPNRGVFRFTTKDLGDYIELESTGEHHHLMLVVRVS